VYRHNYYYNPVPRYNARYSIGGVYGYGDHTRVIYDYELYGLYEPPYGYHWVHDHDRGDAILAAIETGAIIGLIVGAIAY